MLEKYHFSTTIFIFQRDTRPSLVPFLPPQLVTGALVVGAELAPVGTSAPQTLKAFSRRTATGTGTGTGTITNNHHAVARQNRPHESAYTRRRTHARTHAGNSLPRLRLEPFFRGGENRARACSRGGNKNNRIRGTRVVPSSAFRCRQSARHGHGE